MIPKISKTMTKYNISERKEKDATYRTLVNPDLMDELKDKILQIVVMQKKYKDKDYSAKKLAEDIGTNTRYVSAVVNVRFHMNYTSFVNKYRIEEAMFILTDKRYQDLNIEEVSDMVGFANRQSFLLYRCLDIVSTDSSIYRQSRKLLCTICLRQPSMGAISPSTSSGAIICSSVGCWRWCILIIASLVIHLIIRLLSFT